MMRSHCKVGFVNTVLVLVSSCSDEWFYGPERGRERKKVTVILKIMSRSLLLCSGQAAQQHKLQLNIIELCLLGWYTAARNRGAHQSSQINVAVYWVCMARFW